ncbi:MAG: ribonuclease P protein component [Planctomycetota bacterium]
MPAAQRPEQPCAGQPFGRAQRLSARADLQRVFQQGNKLVDRGLVLLYAPAPPDWPSSRLGLSVSRRIGGAPARNRVKRVLREAFRRLGPQIQPPLDVILIARAGSAPRSLAEALAAFERCLPRLARARAADAQRTRPPA